MMLSLLYYLLIVYVTGFLINMAIIIYIIDSLIEVIVARINNPTNDIDRKMQAYYETISEEYGEEESYRKLLFTISIVFFFMCFLWPYTLRCYIQENRKQ